MPIFLAAKYRQLWFHRIIIGFRHLVHTYLNLRHIFTQPLNLCIHTADLDMAIYFAFAAHIFYASISICSLI
jgi:hypothetical protein